MIQANELRIGNIMQDAKGRICTVKQLSIDQNDVKIRAIKGCITSLPIGPIPLTEEILLKCGFQQSNMGFKLGVLEFNYRFDQKFMARISDQLLLEIKHLHQLQNLYFALTGKELEVNI